MSKKKDIGSAVRVSDVFFGLVLGLWFFFLVELVSSKLVIYILMAVVSMVAVVVWYLWGKTKKQEK
jgi:Flp pilus assembly protein TadB